MISIVIPTYNEEKDIEECLKSLQNQSYKNYEIIIVDDGSTDKTRDIVKKFKKVRLIEGQHRGPGFSRNLGVKKARGEILIFVDADMTFDRDYLKNLIKPLLKDKNILGTSHDYETVKNTSNIWSKCWGKVRIDFRGSKYPTKPMNSAFRAIRKDRFLKLGGFNPKYGYADDQTFSFKYNLHPMIAPNTVCYHKNPETLKGVYKQSKWIGASIDNLLFKIPIIKQILPFFMILVSPLIVPFLSLKKSIKNKELRFFFPWMLLFMTARYAGTISGIFRKIYLEKNVR